jgi:hypothetical protein
VSLDAQKIADAWELPRTGKDKVSWIQRLIVRGVDLVGIGPMDYCRSRSPVSLPRSS